MALKRVSRARAVETPPAPLLPPAPPPPAPISLPRPEGAWKFLAYLASLFMPTLGLGLSLLYWKAGEDLPRRFGRVCLILAVLGFIVQAGGEAFHSGLQSGEWFIQPY